MDGNTGTIVGIVLLLTYVSVVLLIVVGMWKVNTKAGKPGWACLIPIYNFIVLIQIAGRPLWWIVLMFVPCVSLLADAAVCVDIAKSFGKSPIFGIGMCFLSPIFFPILGFSDAEYQGPINHE